MQENQGGRPSEFNQETADRICGLVAEGLSVRTISKHDDMPASSTIFKWLAQNPTFAEQYARAKEAQTDAFAEEILDIADDASNDWMEFHQGDNVGWRENGEAIRRSQTRIEARKWLMGKMKPKKYGDKIQQEVTGNLGLQLVNSIPRPEEK